MILLRKKTTSRQSREWLYRRLRRGRKYRLQCGRESNTVGLFHEIQTGKSSIRISGEAKSVRKDK